MSDSRAAGFVAEHGMSSYEVDALPPDALTVIASSTMTVHVDPDLLDEILGQEEKDRELLREASEMIMKKREEDQP